MYVEFCIKICEVFQSLQPNHDLQVRTPFLLPGHTEATRTIDACLPLQGFALPVLLHETLLYLSLILIPDHFSGLSLGVLYSQKRTFPWPSRLGWAAPLAGPLGPSALPTQGTGNT